MRMSSFNSGVLRTSTMFSMDIKLHTNVRLFLYFSLGFRGV